MVISNQAILDYYAGLEDKKEKLKFRAEVMEETGIALPTFYYKIRDGLWSKAENKLIALILERRGYAGEN